jgi:hypothetical protein
MARVTQRLWRASSPLGWTSELGLVGAGPVAILAGFSLAAAVSLTSATKNWAHEAALVLFAVAVTVLILALRFIITAQFYFSSPSDYLVWRPEAAHDPDALLESRDLQSRDYYTYMYYWEKAVRLFPVGVSAALLGLAADSLSSLAEHGLVSSVVTGCVAASVLTIGSVISMLELRDRPRVLFPSQDVALDRVVEQRQRRLEKRKRKSERQRKTAARKEKVKGSATVAHVTPAPAELLPPGLKRLPLDLPGFVRALGDDLATPPLLTPTSRTISELRELLPSDRQKDVFQLACQQLAAEFGAYSTTRTSVLFTITPSPDRGELVAVALHPAASELNDTGVPFRAAPELAAGRSGTALDHVEQELARFPVSTLFPDSGCRLLTSASEVARLIEMLHCRGAQTATEETGGGVNPSGAAGNKPGRC